MMTDVLNSNAFGMSSLTAAIELAPYVPNLLGGLKIFKPKSIRTTVAWIEKRGNKLAILSTANRGTVNDVRSSIPRDAIPVRIPHVPYFQGIIADDIQNMRAFGTETELEVMGQYINEQLEGMKQDHEVTWEFHRVGALKGIILDGDNSTVLYNLFTLFNMTQVEIDWFSTDDSFAPTITSIIRAIGNKLGAASFSRIIALCGNDYFDNIVQHASMQEAYDRWRDGEFKRVSHLGPQWYAAAANGFEYQDVLFINYRGKIADVTFIADDEAYYYPVGVPNMFQQIAAPADFMETVNTMGKPLYSKMERMRFDKGMELHTQSNVLMINTRPDAVIKSTWSATEGS